MAIHTAVFMLVAGGAALALSPDRGLMGILTSDRVGGRMARLLLPGLLVALPVIGWIWLFGERHGFYGTETGIAIFATASTAALFGLLVWTARSLNDSDKSREEASVALRSSEKSLHLARFAVEHAGDAILWADMNQRIVYANRVAFSSLGYDAVEINTLTLADIVPHHDPKRYQERLAILKSGRTVQYESRHRRKDGTTFPVEVVLNYLEQAGQGYTCAVVRDITERKQISEALADREEKFRQVTDHIHEVFWLSDPAKQTVLYVSPAYASIWGRSREGLYANPWSWLEAIHPDDQERVRTAAVTKQVAGVYDEEYRIIRPDGSIRWVRDRAYPIPNETGMVYRLAGVADDVTERKRVQEALQFLSAGIAHMRGDDFFGEMAVHIAQTLQAEIGFVGKFLPVEPPRVRAIGLSIDGQRQLPVDYELANTPCEQVIGKQAAIFPHDVQRLFPADKMLADLNIVGYAAIPLFDASGRAIGHVGVMSRSSIKHPEQVEELLGVYAVRAAVEMERQRIESKFYDLFEFSPDAVIMMDQEWRVALANRRAITLFGYCREEIQGLQVDRLLPEIDCKELSRICRETRDASRAGVLGTGLSEHQALKKDGTVFPIEINFTPLYAEEGFLIVAAVRDITERKQAEKMLRQTTEHLQTLIETAPLPVIELDRNGNVTQWNEASTLLFGWTKDEVLGRPLPYVPEGHEVQADRLWERAVQGCRSTKYEIRRMRKDGTILDLALWSARLPDDGSGVNGSVGFLVDITEQKRVAEALKEAQVELERRVIERTDELAESRKQLEVAIDGANLATWDWNIPTGRFRFNHRWADLRRLNPQEVTPLIASWWESIHPDDRTNVQLHLESYLAAPVGLYEMEMRVQAKTDEWSWTLVRGKVIERAGDGSPIRMAGIEIDITERKRGEQELQRAQAFVNSVVENIPDMVFVKDAKELRFVQLNKAGEALLGYTRGELIGKNDYDFFPMDEADFFTKKDREVLMSGNLLDIPSEPIHTKHLGTRFLHTKKIPLFDEQGNPQHLLGISEDITERQLVEEALRKSEERYSSLVSQATDIIYTAGLDGRFTFVNEAASHITGYAKDELVGKHYLELIRPDFREKAQSYYRQQLLDSIPSSYLEFPAVTKTGREVWIGQHVWLRVVEGTTIGIEAIARDITARKQAESALRESETRLQLASQASKVGLWDWDLRTGSVYFSPEWKAQIGYREDEISGRLDEWERRLHPDDRARVLDYLRAYKAGERAPEQIEFRIQHKDGSYRWMYARGEVMLDASGIPARMLGCHIDITERKQTEAALRESEERFSKIFQSSPHAILITEVKTGRCLDANRAFMKLFGCSREEIVGMSMGEIGLWADPGMHQRFIDRVQRKGGVRNLEMVLRTKRGMAREFLISSEAIVLNGNDCLVTIGNDITDLKIVQAALEEAYDRLQLVTRQVREAEERERRRIARELHDEFGQSLTGLKFDIVWLAKRIPGADGMQARQAIQSKLAGMSESVDSLIRSVRATAAALRPGVLDDLGLVAGIEWLVGSFREHSGLPCALTVDPGFSEEAMEPELITTVFRSTQELLTNVMRHAEASSATVHLTMKEGHLQLLVHDDGRGIRTEDWKFGRSLGLRGLQERVMLVGGSLSIEGDPGSGTTVVLDCPLRVGFK